MEAKNKKKFTITAKTSKKKVQPKPGVLISSNLEDLKKKRALGFSKFQLFPDMPAYAEGFGPTPKLVQFFQKPASPNAIGAVSLLIAFSLVLLSSVSVFQKPQVNQLAIIKTNQTVKTSSIVAGGQSVKWTALIKASDINSGQYLLSLPRKAKNIKITKISAQQAKDVLQSKPTQQLSLSQRIKIAKANQPKTLFVASLMDSLKKLFTASVGDAMDNVAQTVAQLPDPNIATTSDAVVVDLSNQVTPTDKPEVPVSETAVTAPAETPAPEVAPTPEVVSAPAEDYVQVDYETPAPIITEQSTDTGKIVTVSSVNLEKIDCETLNPNKETLVAPDVLSSAGANLMDAVVKFFSSLKKFFSADLEQAISDIIQPVVDQAVPPVVETPAPTNPAIQPDTPPADVASPESDQIPPQTAPEPVAAPSETLAPTDVPAQEKPVPVVEPAPAETPIETTPAVSPAQEKYDACVKSQVPLVDVLASTKIPEIYKVGEESKIQIKWKNPDCEAIDDSKQVAACKKNGEVAFHAFDTDANGKLDYVEWTVPHLSAQIFELIFISKAFQLDENQNIISDVYDQVKEIDGQYANVVNGQFIRVTFNQILDSDKDITLYARPNPSTGSGAVEIYPVYVDENGNQTQGPKLTTVADGQNPDFSNINQYNQYRILLKNLQAPTNTFDLKIIGGPIDFDYIVDPSYNFTVLRNMSSSGDGGSLYGTPVLAGSILYGTAYMGGSSGYGTIWSYNIGTSTFTNLHSFSSSSDGSYPYNTGGVAISGNILYGTANSGGSGYGTVWACKVTSISSPSACTGSNFINLHSFSSSSDGSSLYSGVVISGNILYGTAYGGGANGNGTIWACNVSSISSPGSCGINNLHSFSSFSDGSSPYAGVAIAGNILYGTASSGGSNSNGTVWACKVSSISSPSWCTSSNFTNLHNFSSSSDGSYIYSGVVISGNILYGTANGGGSNSNGTIWSCNVSSISSPGTCTSSNFVNLHSFSMSTDGSSPYYGGVAISGNILYGTAAYGGSNSNGTLYTCNVSSISGPSACTGSNFTVLRSFASADGTSAYAGVAISGTTLYGANAMGGANNYGTIWSLSQLVDRYWINGAGNWNDTSHWSTSSGGGGGASVPNDATFAAHFNSSSGTGTVTLNISAPTVGVLDISSSNITVTTNSYGITVANDITAVGTISGSNTVTLSGGNNKIYGSGTISAPLTISGTYIIDSTANITLSGTAVTINSSKILTNNGTATVANLAGSGTWAQGINSTLNYSGSSIVPALSAGGTVVYNSGSIGQAIKVPTSSYNNLTINNSGQTATLGGSTTVLATLTISSGATLQLGANNLFANGTTSISGTLNDNSATGINQFTGLITINSGGIWTTSNDPAFNIRGGLANNSSAGFTSGNGIYTFSGGAQTITGSQPFTITNLTNNDATGLQINTSNATITNLVQGAGSQLFFMAAGRPTITNLDASTNANYVGYGYNSQVIISTTYSTLGTSCSSLAQTLGGNVVATSLQLGCDLTVGANNLTVSSTLDNSALKTITVSTGAVSIPNGASGNFTFTDTNNIPSASYTTLTINASGKTVTALGAITATTLTVTAGILNMATYDLAITNINNSDTIRTQSTSATPLTTGKNWAGTVKYDAVAGGQTIRAGTYNNLILSNASNIDTASGAIVATTLNTTSGGALAMGSNGLTVSTTLTNSGTITVSTGTVSIPNAASGAFTFTGTNNIPIATYSTLTINSSGTDSLAGATTVNDLNVIAGTLAQGNYTLGVNGNFTLSSGGLFTKSGNLSALTLYGNSLLTDNNSIKKDLGNLVIGGTSNTITLGSDILATNITINLGNVLDASSGNNYGITLLGNWSNSGTFMPQWGTVTLNGTNQTISGVTTFYNLTKNVASSATLTFSASVKQTITNTLNLSGVANNLLSLVSSSPNTQWQIDPQGTRTISYLSVTDSNNTNATSIATAGLNITDGGRNTNWVFDVTPPTTTATATSNSLSYTFGNWTGYSVTVTLSCTDNVGGVGCDTVNYPKYCTDTGTPCTPTTLYTAPFTISAEGTTYVRYYSKDLSSNTETTNISTIKIDTTPPTVAITTLFGFTTYSTYIKGTGTIVGGTATDTGGSGVDNTTCDYTINNGSSWSSASWLADHCQQASVAVANATSYTFNTRIKDAVANQGTGTATAIYTGDTLAPITTDNSNTSWWANNQTITLSPTDAGAGVDSTNYCVDTTGACAPSTPGVSVDVSCASGSACQQYVKYYSNDKLGNTEAVKNATNIVNIDKQAPTTIADAGSYVFDNWTNQNVTVALTCGDAGGSGCLATLYCIDSNNTCTPNISNSVTPPPAFSTSGIWYIRYLSTDAVSNSESIKSQTIKLTTGELGTFCSTVMTCNSGLACSNNACVVIVSAGGSVILPNANNQTAQTNTSILDQIRQQLNNVLQQAQNITNVFNPNIEQSQIQYPPISESVTEESPLALQGWDVMEVKPIDKLALTPVNSGISFFANKIPQFKDVLTAFGINVNNLSSVQKVVGADLYLPGLTQVALAPSGTLATNKFASVQGVPLADLTTSAKQKIPTDIIFARAGGELIDYKVAISVDKAGQVAQKINTVVDKPIELIIKPDQPAESVTGFISLNKVAVGKEPTNILANIGHLLTASIIPSVQPIASSSPKNSALLLNKFTYVETTPGIYTASISAPGAEGEYNISTIIQYKDINIAPKETKMTAIVNPEGYVYSQQPGGRLRIEGASVLLYWLNPATSKYEIWPADNFLQKNPILTDNTGKYSFLVPEGTYKLQVKDSGYAVFESDPFVMKEDLAINKDVELFKKAGWFDWLNWQNIVIILLFIMIISNFWRDEKIRNFILKILKFKKVEK